MKLRRRFFKIIIVFIKVFMALRKEQKIIFKKGFEKARIKMQKVHYKRAEELYELAINMEGVLIKLCQYLSARKDFMPEAYIDVLSRLQDNVPGVDFSIINQIIMEDYPNYYDIFKNIDPVPLASASLAQVHKAELQDGRKVILKVLKTHIEKIIDYDFAILYKVFKIFSGFKAIKKRFDLDEILNEFIRVTGDELNFKREILIAKNFHNKLSKLSYLKIPKVYDSISSRRVIVMEYIQGTKLSDQEEWIKRNNDPKIIAKRLVETYLEQFIFMKMINYDPHPGNIIIMENNEFALIDYGMSGEITDKMSNGIKKGLIAFINRDYNQMLNILEDLGFFNKGEDIYTLLPVMEFFFDKILTSVKFVRKEIQSIDLSPILDDLKELIYTQPIKLPVEWAYIGRTIGTLAGIIGSLYPDINLYNELEPYINRVLKNNFSERFEDLKEEVNNRIKTTLSLPDKLDRIIYRIERGQIKFKFEESFVRQKLEKIRKLLIFYISLGLSIFSLFSTFYFYEKRFFPAILFFSIITGVFLLNSLIYMFKGK